MIYVLFFKKSQEMLTFINFIVKKRFFLLSPFPPGWGSLSSMFEFCLLRPGPPLAQHWLDKLGGGGH